MAILIFDYSKLRGKITEIYGSQLAFVKDLGTSENTFSRKLNNKVRFSVDDIILIITDDEKALRETKRLLQGND